MATSTIKKMVTYVKQWKVLVMSIVLENKKVSNHEDRKLQRKKKHKTEKLEQITPTMENYAKPGQKRGSDLALNPLYHIKQQQYSQYLVSKTGFNIVSQLVN